MGPVSFNTGNAQAARQTTQTSSLQWGQCLSTLETARDINRWQQTTCKALFERSRQNFARTTLHLRVLS